MHRWPPDPFSQESVERIESLHEAHRRPRWDVLGLELPTRDGVAKIGQVLAMASHYCFPTVAEADRLAALMPKMAAMLVAHRDLYECQWQIVIASDLDVWRQKTGVDLGFSGRELGVEVVRTASRRLGWRAPRKRL